MLSACSETIYHQVKFGDTLSEIALKYGVSQQEVARYNSIRNPDKIEVGQQLRIPPAKQQRTPTPSAPDNRTLVRTIPDKKEESFLSSIERRGGDGKFAFIWP